MNTLTSILNALKPTNERTDTKICSMIIDTARSVGSWFVSMETGNYVYSTVQNCWVPLRDYEFRVFIKEALVKMFGRDDGCDRKKIKAIFEQFPYSAMCMNAKPDHSKINFKNGTLDLCNMKFGPHSYSNFLVYVLPFNYDPNATCPVFHRYLDEVLPEKDVQNVLAECVGYVFTQLKLEKVAFFYGKGRNGKSVFLEIVEALVGLDNVSHESLSDLCGSGGENHRANIIGRLLNTCSDVSPSALQGDYFKRLASREPISAKILYKDVVSSSDYGRMMFCLNELPKTTDNSDGYYRRMLIIPFDVQIPKEKVNPRLAAQIIATELPGIMNWALDGRDRLIQNNGFSDCAKIDKALEEYRNHNLPIQEKSPLILPINIKDKLL